MAASTLAAQGLKALDERRYDEAITLLSKAIYESPSPAWLLARARAYDSSKQIDKGLDDAALAYNVASERGNDKSRKQMIEAQYRRAVLYYKKKEYANADCCAVWSQQLAKGRASSKLDDLAAKVDANGNYNVTVAEAEAEKYDSASSAVGRDLMKAMEKDKTGYKADWNKAQMWRAAVLAELETLPVGDSGRKVTVSSTPARPDATANGGEKKASAVLAPSVSTATVPSPASKPASKPAAKAAPRPPAEIKPHPTNTVFKDQSYQSDNVYTVTLSMKFLKKEDASKVTVDFQPHLITVTGVPRDPSIAYLVPWAAIDPAKSTFRAAAMKIEFALAKAKPAKWFNWGREELSQPNLAALEADALAREATVEDTPSANLTTAPEITAPYTSRTNWSKLEKEPEEKGDTEDVNDFFKQLYKNASPDAQRAMMKSYTQSNGTALSTSWEEAEHKTYETNPPDSMEAKKYGT